MSYEPTIGDAFGQALLATLDSGGPTSDVIEIVERSDGFIDPLRMARYFDPTQSWNERTHWAVGQLRGRVLDIGAGGGRISVHLQNLGIDVTALDVSPGAVSVLQRLGIRQTFQGTIFDLAATSPKPFDSFAMFGGNLGLLESKEHAPRMLTVLRELSGPGARIVGDCLDPYDTTEPEHLAFHAANRAAGRMGGQNRLRTRYRAIATDWWDYLFLSTGELEQLIEGTGWHIAEVVRARPQYTVVLELNA